MGEYDWVTDEKFDAMLSRLLTSMTGEEILALEGAYEALVEPLNNRVLDALVEEREAEKAGPQPDPALHMERRFLMNELAEAIKARMPDGLGFGLLVFDFDKGDVGRGELHWVSTARRHDIILAMQEFIKREGN